MARKKASKQQNYLVVGLLLILTLISIGTLSNSVTFAAIVQGENTVPVIIHYKEMPQIEDIEVIEKIGKITYVYSIIPTIAAEIPRDEIEKIRTLPNVLDVEKDDSEATISYSGSYGRKISDGGGIKHIGADKVHSLGATGKGIRICMPDTGIDKNNPILASKIIDEIDFVNNDYDAMDDNGHGTNMATLTSTTAPGASLMVVKIWNNYGIATKSDILAGIDWCVVRGADVISLSIGTSKLFSSNCDSNLYARAANSAVNSGVFVSAASGNHYSLSSVSSPACGSKVIAVGGVNKNDKRFSHSNGGSQLDVMGPGYILTSTRIGSMSKIGVGTSLAVPYVSGTVALLLGEDFSLTPAQISNILRNSAEDLGEPGFDNLYGYGRIDVWKAYSSIVR